MKKSNKKRIFMDYASTTPVHPEVLKAMKPFFSEFFANPSALYGEGVSVKKEIEKARKSVADILRAVPDEIIFTGNGTEADNLVLRGVVMNARKTIPHPHIVVSSIEHPAILKMADRLKNEGVNVSIVFPNKDGIIDPKDVQNVLKDTTVLVSIMYANNEIGTIQPIREIAKVIRHFKKHTHTHIVNEIYFHTDASQAPNYLHIGVPQLGVDLMTLDGSKIYGPKGIGMLYVRRSVSLESQLLGGGQENGLRAGTEFVSGIVGFAKALEIVQKDKEKESKRLSGIQEKDYKKYSKGISNKLSEWKQNQ